MTQDTVNPPQLTERQEKILALIVSEYISRPEPVASKYLADSGLNVSSATIRNDMVVLEELGYIASPHTSAGRVPTETGYRYFVKRLMTQVALEAGEQQTIADEFHKSADLQSWMRVAVSSLARTSHGAALVTTPHTTNSQFKHVELISTQGRLVLMVLVLYGGSVRQQMITLAEALSQDALSAAAARLNALCETLNSEQIRAKGRTLDTPLEREVIDLIADTLSGTETYQHTIAYRDGLSEMLPEFTESEGAQQALRFLEEHSLLSAIFGELLHEQVDDVHVVIGGEGRWSEVRHLSLVLTRYGVTGQATGLLGVLGPTRMRYGRAIASVRYVAGLLNGLLTDVYGNNALPSGPKSDLTGTD